MQWRGTATPHALQDLLGWLADWTPCGLESYTTSLCPQEGCCQGLPVRLSSSCCPACFPPSRQDAHTPASKHHCHITCKRPAPLQLPVKMRWDASTWVMVAVMACLGAWTCHACNEVVCASVVSKCMLTQACKCDLTRSPDNNCTCCRDCAKCLGYLYTECCSCLGMCEPREQVLDRTDSQVGDLPEPFPHMFRALTGEKDTLLRWTSITFPIDVDLTDIDVSTMNKNRYKLGAIPVDNSQDTTQIDQVTVNCTVMYMSQCMSGNKCKETCRSTGATAYRWFFDGCCECVGSTCVNYGINESRCIQCSIIEDVDANDQLTDQYLAGSDEPFDDPAAQGVVDSEDV
ncbi:twisted gastrulation protein homolog 1-B-like isoform X1 [Scylla paramamosain]|uniref:twisted gastrulation protein homolog 1-B-like isoform X1 n=1 Tax=Scylla paramamosain TaxID=85552 RepID=UPI003083966D